MIPGPGLRQRQLSITMGNFICRSRRFAEKIGPQSVRFWAGRNNLDGTGAAAPQRRHPRHAEVVLSFGRVLIALRIILIGAADHCGRRFYDISSWYFNFRRGEQKRLDTGFWPVLRRFFFFSFLSAGTTECGVCKNRFGRLTIGFIYWIVSGVCY